MTFEMTQTEAATLARFIEQLRHRMTGDDWHKPGIENALGQARHRAPAHDLAIAAIRAASEPSNRTPAIIGMDGPHWQAASKPPRPRMLDATERCSICSYAEDVCQSRWADDHTFESMAVAAARKAEANPDAVQGAIRALKEELAATPKREPARTGGLESLADRDPKLRARVDALRAALPKEPPMREPEPARIQAVRDANPALAEIDEQMSEQGELG